MVAGLMTITPGMDTALVLRSAIRHGRRHALFTVLGVTTGVLVWGMAAAVGVSALLTTSQVAYTALRWAGAAYLVWFGISMLRRTLRPKPSEDGRAVTEVAAGASDRGVGGGLMRAWASGLATNLLNPKVGVFYVAMLPQFIPSDAPHLLAGVLLAGVHNLEGLAWFTLLIACAGLARSWLNRETVHRWIDRITGTILIGFGVRLALPE